MKTVRILILEDNYDSADMLKTLLESIGSEAFTVTVARSQGEALAELAAGVFDIGLLDLNVGDSSGIRTFRGVHSAAPDMPIVILSATDDQELALQAVQEGAQDFLVKPTDSRRIITSLLYALERQVQKLQGGALAAARIAVDLIKEIADRLEQVVSSDAETGQPES